MKPKKIAFIGKVPRRKCFWADKDSTKAWEKTTRKQKESKLMKDIRKWWRRSHGKGLYVVRDEWIKLKEIIKKHEKNL